MIKGIKRLRKGCLLVMIGVMMISTTACDASATDSVKNSSSVACNNTLKNNQDSKVKEIIKVKNFAAHTWLNENEIIGTTKENSILYLAVYNNETKSIKKIGNETNFTEKMLLLEDFGDFVICKRTSNWGEGRGNAYLSYLINKKDFSYFELSKQTTSVAHQGDTVLFTQGEKLFKYDTKTKERTEIKLNEKLVKEMIFNKSLAQYIEEKTADSSDDKDRLAALVSRYTGRYNRLIKNKAIFYLRKYIGEEVILMSQNSDYYIYNLNTQKYRIASLEDRIVFNNKNKKVVNRVEVKTSDKEDNMYEMWKNDENGKNVSIIAKTNTDFGNMNFSHINNKLIYSVFSKDFRNEKIYVYDFKTNEKDEIGNCTNLIYETKWLETKNEFFYTYESEKDETETSIDNVDTAIVILK